MVGLLTKSNCHIVVLSFKSTIIWIVGELMTAIPTNVIELIKKEGTVKALVTASKDGTPHAIVAGTISSPSPDMMAYGEILSKTSVKNLAENSKVAFLIVNGLVSYEIGCKVKAKLTSGPELDGLNKALEPMHLHAHALWLFDVQNVYEQGANPNAGKKIA